MKNNGFQQVSSYTNQRFQNSAQNSNFSEKYASFQISEQINETIKQLASQLLKKKNLNLMIENNCQKSSNTDTSSFESMFQKIEVKERVRIPSGIIIHESFKNQLNRSIYQIFQVIINFFLNTKLNMECLQKIDQQKNFITLQLLNQAFSGKIQQTKFMNEKINFQMYLKYLRVSKEKIGIKILQNFIFDMIMKQKEVSNIKVEDSHQTLKQIYKLDKEEIENRKRQLEVKIVDFKQVLQLIQQNKNLKQEFECFLNNGLFQNYEKETIWTIYNLFKHIGLHKAQNLEEAIQLMIKWKESKFQRIQVINARHLTKVVKELKEHLCITNQFCQKLI